MQELNETEQKIVDAAAQVFLESGKAGARTQVIADRAGINKAMLHYYFRTKEKLYEIVAEKVIGRVFNQVLSNISDEQEFEIWLPGFVHNYLSAISSNPMITRFMLWEIEAGGGRVAQIVKDIFQMDKVEENPLYKIITKAVKSGKIRPIDPVQFIITLLAICVFPYVARPLLEKVIPGLDIRSDKFRREREKAVLDLIWNGIRIPACEPASCPSTDILSNFWLLW